MPTIETNQCYKTRLLRSSIFTIISRKRVHEYPSGDSRIGEHKVLAVVPPGLSEMLSLTPNAVLKCFLTKGKVRNLVLLNTGTRMLIQQIRVLRFLTFAV